MSKKGNCEMIRMIQGGGDGKVRWFREKEKDCLALLRRVEKKRKKKKKEERRNEKLLELLSR